MVQRALAAINDDLFRRGSELRLPDEVLLPGAREALSIRLIEVLRETRDRSAFELLYRLNAPVLERFVRHRVRDLVDLDPADVVDETFLRVFTRCETFRVTARSTFTGWAMVIAENIIRQERRSVRRSGRVAWSDDWSEQAVAPAAREEPSRRLEEAEVRALLIESWPTVVRLCAAGLLRLPPRWRRALELREGEGLSYLQIADRMDLRVGHVAMLLHRARCRVLQYVTGMLAPYREVER